MKSERAKQYLLKAVTPMAMMYPDCPEECDLKLGEAKQAVELAELIDKVSGRGTWDLNPWVVVYEFELVK